MFTQVQSQYLIKANAQKLLLEAADLGQSEGWRQRRVLLAELEERQGRRIGWRDGNGGEAEGVRSGRPGR